MNNQTIRFGGIIRSTNSHDSNLGDCEEMINIRSEAGSLKLDKDHKVISADIPYKRILLHDTNGRRNYIGYDNNGVIWFDPTTGSIIKRLYSSNENLEDIHIATINNMLIISDKTDVSNTVYLFTQDTYNIFIDQNGLDIPITVTHTTNYVEPDVYSISEGDLQSAPFKLDFSASFTGTEQDRLNILTGARNRFFSENKRWVMGYYLVGINFTLWDGTETKLTKLTPFYPTQMQYNDSYHIAIPLVSHNTANSEYVLDFTNLIKSHSYTIKTSADISEYKEYIKAVNVYVSDPVDVMVFESDYVDFYKFPLENATYIPLGLIKAELDKQLLYKSASYTLDDIASNKATANIEFGVDYLPTNKTLDVDNGLITRAGQMLSYNNRLHYFNSKCKLDLTQGYHIISNAKTGIAFTADILIYLRGPESDVILRYNDQTFYSRVSNEPYFSPLDAMIIVQDSRAYKVVILRPGYYCELLLNSSSRYNYSFGYFKQLLFTAGTEYQDVEDNSGIYQETNAINVTAQNNPFVFPVEHSYAVNGTINKLGLATEPISQTQIGQYPLYIFTDKGIYALEQGSGAVLYSNLILINTDTCNNDICQTRNGVAYIANGNVYILAGRNNLNISLPLRGPIDMDIRQSSSYQLACMGQLYDISKYLSQVPIEEFLKNAMLSYIASTDDLIVSNPDYPYSYIFSFAYKNWHKSTQTFGRVGDNILQRYILTNHTTDLRATGRIYVTNAVIQPSHQFSALFQAVANNITYTTGFSEKYALIIDGVQVSAALFRYPTQLSVLIALLCKDIPYLDEYYDGNYYRIYNSMALRSGALLEVINLKTKYTVLSATFEDVADTVVTIPSKGIGDKITISASDRSYSTRAIQSSDTVISLAEEVTDIVNSYASYYGVSAMMSNNVINLAALVAGDSGNNIIVRAYSGNYISTYVEPMQGGKDLTLSPGDYTQLVDYSESEDTVKTFHLQSRPISWPNAYTIINRLILLCKTTINQDCNLSMYLFASDNLKEWKCVAASQKSNVILDHIRLQRTAISHKYYIIMIGGKVFTTTELSSISLSISTHLDNKLR